MYNDKYKLLEREADEMCPALFLQNSCLPIESADTDPAGMRQQAPDCHFFRGSKGVFGDISTDNFLLHFILQSRSPGDDPFTSKRAV